jgi:hypothetical protein
MPHIYLESYGVRLDVEVQDQTLQPLVERILPPGWARSNEFPEDGHFTLSGDATTGYQVLVDGAPVGMQLTAEVAVHVLDSQLRLRIAVRAQKRVFVHAGVVVSSGRALLLPGPSFSGKSTLVAALVAQGATYYSDEFAVLDDAGLVYPYPRPISVRAEDERYGEYSDIASLGGDVGAGEAAVAVIAATRYVPGLRWNPQRRNPAVGGLALLANAVPARSRPRETLSAVSRAANNAVVLDGERGEAGEIATKLLEILRAVGGADGG